MASAAVHVATPAATMADTTAVDTTTTATAAPHHDDKLTTTAGATAAGETEAAVEHTSVSQRAATLVHKLGTTDPSPQAALH